MRKVFNVSLSCIICLVVAGSALAMPSWRTCPAGEPPTTYQEWTFDDDDNPAIPEVVANTYGMPEAALSGEPLTFGWYQIYDGRQGVWHAESLDVVLDIPNRQVSDEYKEIWVEAVFQGNVDAVGLSPIPPGTMVTLLDEQIVNLDNYWKKLTIGWRIEPNPYSEKLCLGFSGTGGSIDYIIAETICIPEPATVLLLGIGGLALVKLRKT